MSNKIRMTGYYRVSTKAEAQKSSFENQPIYFTTTLKQPQFKDYVRTQKFYCDYGVSGTKLSRPGFEELLHDAGLTVEIEDKPYISHPDFPDKKMKQRIYKVSIDPNRKPLFDEIWMKSTSRLARNINVLEILNTLTRNHVYVYFLDTKLSTRNEEDITSIRRHLLSDMEYSEKLSRDMRIVREQYKRENRIRGDLYGYTYVPKSRNNTPYYKINPVEAEVVSKIFQLCIEGHGVRSISKILLEQGIVSNSGKPFSKTTLLSMLQNEKYMGYNFTGKYTTGSLFDKMTPQKTKDYRENLVKTDETILPPIITEETFYKAQEQLKARMSSDNKGIHNQTANPYNHLLVCSKCGSHFVFEKNPDDSKSYYKCSKKKYEGVSACNCANVFQYKLDAFLKDLCDGGLYRIIEQDYFNNIFSLLKIIQDYTQAYLTPTTDNNELDNLLKQQKDLENKRRIILQEMMMSASMSEDYQQYIQTKLEELDEELSPIKQKIQELSTSTDNRKEKVHHYFDIIFEQLKTLKSQQKIFTLDEVLSKLECIKIYGESENNGGAEPKTVLVPILKSTIFSQGLTDAGYTDFRYKFRNGLPNYDGIDHFIPTKRQKQQPLPDIPLIDREDITEAERHTGYSYGKPESWSRGTVPFILITNELLSDAMPYKGFENMSLLEQLETYTNNLYQKFCQL